MAGWTTLEKLLKGEIIQREEEGCDVTGFAQRLEEAAGDNGRLNRLYDELMELMASEELYADQDKFNAALGEYNGLKQELPKLEDEWLELSTQIEEETARELS